MGELGEFELRCLELCASGFSDQEIAQTVGRTAVLVRLCVENARTKLGARSRAHAVVLAIKAGLIELDSLPVVIGFGSTTEHPVPLRRNTC